MKQFRNIMLGLGLVYPWFSLVAYLVWIKIDASNDVIVLMTICTLSLAGVLLAVALGRRLNDRQLLWGGISGYAVVAVMVVLFVSKATAPVVWRKPAGIPAFNAKP